MKKLATIIILSLGMNCVFALNTPLTENLQPNKSIPANDPMPLVIGWGYDTNLKMSAYDTPINNWQSLPIIYRDLQSQIRFNNVVDLESLAEDLNVDISLSSGWGRFSTDASAGYLRHISETDYTDSFTYSEKFFATGILDTSLLEPGIQSFTPAAQKICQSDPTCRAGIAPFTDRYGDAVIKALPLGALLDVNIQIKFNNRKHKEVFNESISGGIGSLFHASEQIRHAVEKSGAKGSLELSARQIGGDPSELATIFKQAPGGSYYITTCNLDSLDSCENVIGGILDYAKGKFAEQIKFKDGKPQGILSVVGKLEPMPYSVLFNLTKPEAPGREIIEARIELAKLHDNVTSKKNFVDHILSSATIAPLLTESAKNALQKTQYILAGNLDSFQSYSAMSCYLPGEWNRCPAIAQSIKQDQQPVDEELIQYFKRSYICTWDNEYQILLGEEQPGNHKIASFRQDLVTNTVLSETWKFSEDKQTMMVDAIDIQHLHIWGTFSKISGGCYRGQLHYSDGTVFDTDLCPISNPF